VPATLAAIAANRPFLGDELGNELEDTLAWGVMSAFAPLGMSPLLGLVWAQHVGRWLTIQA